jgi:hypothetical protein
MAERILAGCIRHAAGTYRAIVDRSRIEDSAVVQPLLDAEAWSMYPFPIPRTTDEPSDR